MGLVKYNRPSVNGRRVNSGFDSFFDDFFTKSLEQSFAPSVDVLETENSFQLELTLPGLKKEEIEIDVKEGVLTVSGERKRVEEKEGEKYHRIESQFGSFKRSFQLPETIDLNKVEGKFENGILTITLPKDEQKTVNRKIEIK